MSSVGWWEGCLSKTFLNSCRLVPSSPNLLRKFSCSNGVLLAWVNLRPASSKHAFSRECFVVKSDCKPSGVGPVTTCSAPCHWVVLRISQTILAVFLAFSAALCCFHNDFVVVPVAVACARMIPASQVSR